MMGLALRQPTREPVRMHPLLDLHQEVPPRMHLPLDPHPRQAIGPNNIQGTTPHILLLHPLSRVDLLLMVIIMSMALTEALHSPARLPTDLQAGVPDSHWRHRSPGRAKGMEGIPLMDSQAGSLRFLDHLQAALATHTLSLLAEAWDSLARNHSAHLELEDLPLSSLAHLHPEGTATEGRTEVALVEAEVGEQERRQRQRQTICEVCKLEE